MLARVPHSAVVTLFALVACYWTDNAAVAEDMIPGSSRYDGFTVATFNAGLARGALPYADERLTLIGDAVRDLAVDAICLQEVWSDADTQALISAAEPVYPYAFRKRTDSTSQRAARCGLFTTLGLDRCVKSNRSNNGVPVFDCVEGACKPDYQALGDDCQRCLAANPDKAWRCATGLFRADEYVYGGRNGLLLLSRWPIEQAEYRPFDAALVRRGVISATIAGRTIHCTHLTAPLESVPYPDDRSFGGYVDEQAAQVEAITDTAPSDRCEIVLGDTNNGPSTGALDGYLADIYAMFKASGFVEAWPDRRCTYCENNPLTGNYGDLHLDHIFYRGCEAMGPPFYDVILDQAVRIEVDGQVRSIRLSDHYGLSSGWASAPR